MHIDTYIPCICRNSLFAYFDQYVQIHKGCLAAFAQGSKKSKLFTWTLSWTQEPIVNPRTHRESKNPSWIPSGRRKTWCQETLGHLSQGTGWYLASWSCLCSAVLGHGGGGCPSTALHRHDQLAKYHPMPWLRWPNVSWHQVFRLPEGIHDGFLDSR